MRHLHQRLALGLDAVDVTRLWEAHDETGRALELKEGLRLGIFLDKLGQVTSELLQLQVFDGDDVVAHAVDKAGVVRNQNRGDVGERLQVLFDPLHVHHVQVVRGFVHEQNIRVQAHRAREREFHAPAARKEGDQVARAVLHLTEADVEKHLLHRLFGNARRLDARIGQNVIHALQIGKLADDVGFDEDGAKLGGGREAFNLFVGDGAHERRLTAVVTAEKGVLVATPELQLGVVQQNL